MTFEFISVLILSVAIIFLYFYLLKNTVFGLNFKTANYVGFFLVFEIFFYLLPGIVLLNLFPVHTFFAVFKVEQSTVYWISLIILYSFISLIFSLWFFSILLKKYLMIQPTEKLTTNINTDKSIIQLTRFIVICCLIFLTLLLIFTDAQHAFLSTITGDVSLSGIRATNKSIGLAKYLNHLFIFIGPLIAILIATTFYDTRRIERFILFTCAILLSTYMGSKGPLMNTILTYIVSYFTFHHIRLAPKNILFIFFFSIIMFLLLYFVVTLQYPNFTFDTFLEYFVNRIFIAQIVGVYEEYNLLLSNWSYWWHSIPFASFFTDYPIFHKDLMMISEDRIDPSSIGIKNTLFIAEAYAFGGWLLVLISPFIYIMNIVFSFLWFNYFLNIVINNQPYTKYIVGLFLFSYISLSGGFSDILFFKLPIMITIFLSIFIVPLIIFKFLYNTLIEITNQKEVLN
jgi:hypothetical protein